MFFRHFPGRSRCRSGKGLRREMEEWRSSKLQTQHSDNHRKLRLPTREEEAQPSEAKPRKQPRGYHSTNSGKKRMVKKEKRKDDKQKGRFEWFQCMRSEREKDGGRSRWSESLGSPGVSFCFLFKTKLSSRDSPLHWRSRAVPCCLPANLSRLISSEGEFPGS